MTATTSPALIVATSTEQAARVVLALLGIAVLGAILVAIAGVVIAGITERWMAPLLLFAAVFVLAALVALAVGLRLGTACMLAASLGCVSVLGVARSDSR